MYDRNLWFLEQPLIEWFKTNFKSLGFEEVIHEDDMEYEPLRVSMNLGKTFPDFLCFKVGKWVRVEIEKTATCYSSHVEGYADLILCYVNDTESRIYRGAQVISLEELQRLHEITVFDELVRSVRNFEEQRYQDVMKKMGQSIV